MQGGVAGRPAVNTFLVALARCVGSCPFCQRWRRSLLPTRRPSLLPRSQLPRAGAAACEIADFARIMGKQAKNNAKADVEKKERKPYKPSPKACKCVPCSRRKEWRGSHNVGYYVGPSHSSCTICGATLVAGWPPVRWLQVQATSKNASSRCIAFEKCHAADQVQEVGRA